MATLQQDVLSFRQAGPPDLELLRDLSIKTFRDTYGDFNTEEDMTHHVATVFHPDRLLGEISDPRIGYYIAFDGDKPVGYIRVNHNGVQTDVHDPASLELERIYVLKEFQGRRYGDQLILKAMDLARDAGLDYVWLGVWKKNEKAIRFYERMGFTIFGTHDFVLGNDPQSDWLMKRILDSGF